MDQRNKGFFPPRQSDAEQDQPDPQDLRTDRSAAVTQAIDDDARQHLAADNQQCGAQSAKARQHVTVQRHEQRTDDPAEVGPPRGMTKREAIEPAPVASSKLRNKKPTM